MPRGKFTDWLNDYSDWLITPPDGAGTESPEDMWCGACNCIIKRKKYNVETHMKTVKHMRAMGIISADKKPTSHFIDNSDDFVIVNTQSSDIEDPFYETISTVGDCMSSQLQTVHVEKHLGEPHVTYFTAPDVKKEKKMSYYSYSPSGSTYKFPGKYSINTKKVIEEDEFFVYGKHVANELRAVEDPFALQTMKMKINTILFEGRTGQYNRITRVEEEHITAACERPSETKSSITKIEENEAYIVTCPSMPNIT